MSQDPFLLKLGWDTFFQTSFQNESEPKRSPARITGQERGHYRIQCASGEMLEAVITNKLRHSAKDVIAFPAVGDWITYTLAPGAQQANIHQILKRKNCIQRKKAGGQAGIQLIATNVDTAFVVCSLNEDFDLDRLGRYVSLCQESQVPCVLLLTKADLCTDPKGYLEMCAARFRDLKILLISSLDPISLLVLKDFFSNQKTCLLLGSSGVGKSTLTNYLTDSESQKTQTVSAESRGRHTTTSRNLLMTKWGGIVIDTPGMQDILGIEPEQNAHADSSDIEALALKCKFSNCLHKTEPGCAITSALKSGELDSKRWSDFLQTKPSNIKVGRNKS